MATLDSKLVGVLGDRTTKVLKENFGYETVGDLLHHYPRRYLVRGELSNIAELNAMVERVKKAQKELCGISGCTCGGNRQGFAARI